ncbi:VOC family protein [Niastella sp. OAS944]|uniref:VOC family protein n=1 Tax=Niastella sp. OAS944 TaxID=2664089 RepID=UPI003491480A|nr:catechol 2,3-dioxygenase-like lactoylglutathione lyase family enzyme [Chitinophagaceae bacterium OAS944]
MFKGIFISSINTIFEKLTGLPFPGRSILFVTFFYFTIQPLKAQQKAGILGVDHIGINVPDLKQGVDFFTEVLGFTPVTQIGPIDLNEGWKTSNRLSASTKSVTIKMVRAGTGANIELFEYKPKLQRTQQPGGDGPGTTHIAFYTDDIRTAVAYLRSKAVKIIGEPFLTPFGDTKGETWVYFETPWGSKMELTSYPDGKAYEKNNPKVLLWSPKNYELEPQKTKEMTIAAIIAIVEQHIALWNEHDAQKRAEIAEKIYAPDIEMVDRHFTAIGAEKIDSFIRDLQQKNPAARFTHQKAIDAHTNLGRLFWQFGTADKPDMVTGMDLFVLDNNLVKKLYVFVNDK